MNDSPRNILVIGGTGFIGYHIVNALLTEGSKVTVLCRNADRVDALFDGRVKTIANNIHQLNTADYVPMLKPFDGVVFAAGVDERSKIEGDADSFFYRNNIWPCEQLFDAIPQTGVHHAVLLNSIFAWLDARHPELGLTTHHPYIRSRVEQNRVAQDAVRNTHCVLTTLQVPWIFGRSPHLQSQWNGLVNYVRGAVPVHCIHGSVNVMSVKTLAQAVCGALHYPQHSSALPVGDKNLSHAELMQHIAECAGREDVHIHTLSDSLFRDITSLGGFLHDVFGLEGGLDIGHLSDLLLQNIVFDPSESQQYLHYAGGDWLHALQDTVDTVEENPLMSGWRKWLNWINKL